MAKCTRKLIDAEAAKAAIEKSLRFHTNVLSGLRQRMKTDESHIFHREGVIDGMAFCLAAIDALPDASEKAIHAERIPVPPHLAEVQRVVIRQAQQAGDGAEEE